jgi:hypothetical protein
MLTMGSRLPEYDVSCISYRYAVVFCLCEAHPDRRGGSFNIPLYNLAKKPCPRNSGILLGNPAIKIEIMPSVLD